MTTNVDKNLASVTDLHNTFSTLDETIIENSGKINKNATSVTDVHDELMRISANVKEGDIGEETMFTDEENDVWLKRKEDGPEVARKES